MQNEIETPELATPSSLVLFVTGKCNAGCSHCFYSKQLNNDDDQISPERFEAIVGSLSMPANLSLTGGEPFILHNLAEYLEIALAASTVGSISIPSNGFFYDRMIEIVDDFCDRFDKPVRIQLSLDGLAGTNDEIRRLKNGYERVLDSARWLHRACERYPHLTYVISTTIMKKNLDEIVTLIGALKVERLNHKITFVRGNDFSTFNVPEEIIRKDYNSREELPGHDDLWRLEQEISEKYPDFLDSYSRRKIEATLSTLEQQQRDVPCYAGTRDGVVFHDGTVGLCEQVVPFGHLSQWDWNLSAAWNSAEAHRHRSLLRRCSCIHGCNIATAVNSLVR